MSVSYGGQAVLEGVMMRGPAVWSVAVRTPNGDVVEVTKSVVSPMQRHRIWRLPVIRGVVALGESLAIGFRALAISANYAMQEEREEGAEGEPVEVSTEISRWQIIVSFVIAIGFALTLFKVGPALLTSWLPIDGTYKFVVVEGLELHLSVQCAIPEEHRRVRCFACLGARGNKRDGDVGTRPARDRA